MNISIELPEIGQYFKNQKDWSDWQIITLGMDRQCIISEPNKFPCWGWQVYAVPSTLKDYEFDQVWAFVYPN